MKRWREMTTQDVAANNKRQCQYCHYFSGYSTDRGNSGQCDYLLIHNHSRGCSPLECVERGIFQPKKKGKRRADYVEAVKRGYIT